MFYDTTDVAENAVFTAKSILIIAIILIVTILVTATWILAVTVKRQAYDYGYEQADSILYSNPDVALSKQAIRLARALTGSTDPVYDACIERFPREFTRDRLSGLSKALFGDEALEWVIDGIDDAFDEFLGERK